jgi:hypothetical protein
LFWIEGAVTMGVAISGKSRVSAYEVVFWHVLAAFILPDLPTNSKGFTEEELLVARMRMEEDVGEADVDSAEQGAFDGLLMALKDTKIYVLMFTLTAYVVGLSFNAFFVSLDLWLVEWRLIISLPSPELSASAMSLLSSWVLPHGLSPSSSRWSTLGTPTEHKRR